MSKIHDFRNSNQHEKTELDCVRIAEVAQLKRGKTSGREEFFTCPLHEDKTPSLRIDRKKNVWFCSPCQTGGTAWKLAASIAGVSPDDKKTVSTWLRDHGLWTESNGSENAIVATYDYTDENGSLLFQVVRTEPKDFRQRRPDGNGGFVWNMTGVSRVPYHLPELSRAERVFIVEGEKDVDALRRLGLTATTSPGGAGKWSSTFRKYFTDRQHVVVIPDNDEPGRKHAEQVAGSLHGHVASLKILQLEGLSDKGDVSDWLVTKENFFALDELLWLVDKCPEWTPPPVEPKSDEDVESEQNVDLFGGTDSELDFAKHPSDLGNALRLVNLHGKDIRYVGEWGWLVWDSHRWAMDKILEIERRAKGTVRRIYNEIPTATTLDQRTALARHALKSESAPRINAMIQLAQSEIEVCKRPGDFDSNPLLFNVQGSTIDLQKCDSYRNRREDMITKVSPVILDPAAQCPKFLAFLDRIMGGNKDLIGFLQRAFGYSLTGLDVEQVLFIFYGTGANGKSTLLNTISTVLGDYAASADSGTLMDRDSDVMKNDLAALAGKRFVSSIEIGKGRNLSEKLVKQLTGSDPVTARFLYREFFSFRATFKIFLGVNHRPIVRGTDLAIWRRIRLVPFNVIIPDEEKIQDYHKTLIKEEKAGILNWLLEGCSLWQQKGLGFPSDVEKATNDYREEMDVIGDWRDTCCDIDPTATSRFGELYKSYVDHSEANKIKPVSSTRFGIILTEQGFRSDRDPKGTRLRYGIKAK